MRRKITPEILQKLKELRGAGLSYSKIAQHYGLSVATVAYNLSESERQHTIARNTRFLRKRLQDPAFREKRRAWMREYMRARYRDDPVFREKVRLKCKEYQKKARLARRLQVAQAQQAQPPTEQIQAKPEAPLQQATAGPLV